MRTRAKADIEADIAQVQAQIEVARHHARDWASTANAHEECMANLREELSALPPEPVKLRVSTSGCIYAGQAEGSEYVARVFAHDCERSGIDADELTKYLLRFTQPDPNAAALEAADVLAEAAQAWDDSFGWPPAAGERANTHSALTAYRAARGVKA